MKMRLSRNRWRKWNKTIRNCRISKQLINNSRILHKKLILSHWPKNKRMQRKKQRKPRKRYQQPRKLPKKLQKMQPKLKKQPQKKRKHRPPKKPRKQYKRLKLRWNKRKLPQLVVPLAQLLLNKRTRKQSNTECIIQPKERCVVDDLPHISYAFI